MDMLASVFKYADADKAAWILIRNGAKLNRTVAEILPLSSCIFFDLYDLAEYLLSYPCLDHLTPTLPGLF